MKEFIGHRLKVLADNFPGPVDGIMVQDRTDMFLLKGSDGKITRIIKSKVSGFVPMDFEPVDFVSFHMMYCENVDTKCPGVQFIQEGDGVSRKDFDKFMSPCPCRAESCKFGTKGELRSVPGSYLRKVITGAVFGEYPEKERKNVAITAKKPEFKPASPAESVQRTEPIRPTEQVQKDDRRAIT